MSRVTLTICLVFAAFLFTRSSGTDAAEIARFDGGPFVGMGYPHSESARAGNLLFLAGQIGEDEDGNLVPGGIQAKAEQMLLNIAAALDRHAAP